MRNLPLMIALSGALLGFAGNAPAQAIPDAPQPQKKPTAKPSPPATDNTSAKPDAPTPSPGKDENAFPEAVSQDAAKAAATDVPDKPKSPTENANPFPEAVSRSAAKEVEQETAPAAKTNLPPGVSSSQSQGPSDAAPVYDPARARKDTQVGGFYLKSGDYQGALLRYQDATAADPTNVDAIFGLAEAQRSLGKNAEAARQFQLYLDIVPNGSKAKEAIKALKILTAAK